MGTCNGPTPTFNRRGFGGPIPDLRTVRSFEDYLHFQIVLAVRDAEILAARYIPYLAVAITILAILPRLAGGIKEFVDARSRQEATPAAG